MKSILYTLILFLTLVSCSKESTIYNGFIQNNSLDSITFTVKADSAVADSFIIDPQTKQLVVTYQEDGDFEIFDCNSFFDTIYFTKNDTDYIFTSDSLDITRTTSLNSSIRTHHCTIQIH